MSELPIKLKDDYLGERALTVAACRVCNAERQICVCMPRDTKTIKLPEGIEATPNLIWFKVENYKANTLKFVPIFRLGITCGCYAKSHRQIAHIKSRSKANG